MGAWYTPDELVDLVVDRTIDHTFAAAVDARPAGAGARSGVRRRALPRLGRATLRALGVDATLTGVDVDPRAVAAAEVPGAELITADALSFDWGGARFDVVVGNPPFLSQMSASTTRGGASRHGGGPYADAAAEFLALAIRLAEPVDGRVGSCCHSRSSRRATPGRCVSAPAWHR